uniref:LLM class flavin-dependent oxidoreductase n=1 Tax=Roseihalotalea indica TaxID=2867963 RepID=A0AA49JCW9_9BACT|nr:LLM class flavin-dependent oxidoreductase [Tunicatimonas sp. TK19036]
MEFGIYTFVENLPDQKTGQVLSPAQRISDLMEEIKLADEAGLNVFGIGEHHREEYLSSSPTTILAAAAGITRQIRLSSAVTVLSSEDPVRAYQQFATLDLLSKGRAEIMVGRGSFIESFPLFGYDLNDYDELFAEKLDLLLTLRENKPVNWKGNHRSSIQNLPVYPYPVQSPLPIWVAVGGTPQSAYRAGYLGLPMAVAIIGGMPEQFKQLTEIHRRGASDAGKPKPALSINSHGFIAENSQDASDISFPAFKQVMDKIGRERGWPPMSREQFEASRTLRGANVVGSPQEVIDKILFQHEIFGHDRFLLQMSVGSIPHSKMMRSLELFATKVAPVVNKAIGSK